MIKQILLPVFNAIGVVLRLLLARARVVRLFNTPSALADTPLHHDALLAAAVAMLGLDFCDTTRTHARRGARALHFTPVH